MRLMQRLRSMDTVIVVLTIVLTIFGLAMLMSATGPVAMARTGDSLYYVKRQLLSGVLPGMLLFFFLALVDYRRWKPFALLALAVSVVLLLLVYLPGIGVTVNGARGWVSFGALRFQPSELVKLTYLVYLSAWLAGRRSSAHDPQSGLLPFAASVGTIMLLLILQPDTGSMAVIVGTSILLYFLSGAPIGYFLGLCALGVGFVWMLIRFSPYRAARFMTFLHPELDPKGIGYHINQAILAIGSGGIFGLGYGHSRQKFLYLPEVESDSIAAVMGEELGYLMMLFVLVAFGTLIWRCFTISRESRDPFGAYLTAGIGTWIGIQVILNMGSMCGLLPITGVTLPFISHGGSAMTVLLGAMGLVAGISRSSHKKE